jgi:hypothetical protein
MLRVREISLLEPQPGFPSGRLLEKRRAGNPEGIASNEAAQPAIRLLGRDHYDVAFWFFTSISFTTC